jgi:hypothetical protein
MTQPGIIQWRNAGNVGITIHHPGPIIWGPKPAAAAVCPTPWSGNQEAII